MKNNILLAIGIGLLFIGFVQPDLNFNFPNNNIEDTTCVVDAPSSDVLLEKSRSVIDILKKSSDSTRKSDCKRLSSLYCDMATLIELDKTDQVIKDTAAIREANVLAGKMLRLNIKNKYPGLAEAANDLLTENIGSDDVVLDEEGRTKAVEAFRALSWAFHEGSK